MHIRWQGGALEDITVQRPPKIYDRWRYGEEIIQRVKELRKNNSDKDVAKLLNEEGLVSAKGKPFTESMIKWIRYRYEIPSPNSKRDDELSVKEVASKFGVSIYVVYYWLDRGIIEGRRMNKGTPYWIAITPEKDTELRNWVRNSTRISKSTSDHSDGQL